MCLLRKEIMSSNVDSNEVPMVVRAGKLEECYEPGFLASLSTLSDRPGDAPENSERRWRLEHESRAARGKDRKRPKGKHKKE